MVSPGLAVAGTTSPAPWSAQQARTRDWFLSLALVSRDGQRLFGALSPQLSEGDQIALWPRAGPAPPPVELRPGESVCSLDLSPDERYLLAGTSGPRMRLWEVPPP